MKKNIFILTCLFLINNYYGQNTRLNSILAKDRIENNNRLSSFLKNSSQKFSKSQLKEIISTHAGFAGNIPLFWESEDMRANKSANILSLQNGTLTGLNNTLITGSSQKILVMDRGRVFEKHNEFGGPTNGGNRIFDQENGEVAYASHATDVAGIIGAIGIGDFSNPYGTSGAKGVLTNVMIDSYSFNNTTKGNNYQKLAASNANISNHSYGVNVGWNYVSTPFSIYTTKGFYWVANYELNTEDTYSGAYSLRDKSFDEIVYTNPNQIVIKSAGNYYGTHPSQNTSLPKFKYDNLSNTYVPFDAADVIPTANCSQGYNCIGEGSLAKNIIVVGATNQLTTADYQYTTSNDVAKASYSSAGPRKDGAIKPDISAVGSTMALASYSNATTYNTYGLGGNGTSYSAPIVTGIAGALTEVNRMLYNNNSFIFKADEMKALLTHTANEAGNIGPDVWYGWGFVDASKAAQVLIDKKDNKAFFERNVLNSGTKFTKTVIAKDGESLKATISWIDPAANPFSTDYELQNNHSSMIINDFDLRIIDTVTNTIYYPWKLDISNPMAPATQGDNTVDNVEQVIIPTPIAGRMYRVEVSQKGNLVDNNQNISSQNYAIIITGFDSSASLQTSENSKEKLVTVYPTKTKDIVNVLIPKGAKTIDIFDLSGKSVLKTEAKSFQTIDVSQLPKGTYIINVKTDKNVSSHKFIKE